MSTFAIESSAHLNLMAPPLSSHSQSATALIPAFEAAERRFGEHFNASSHGAVIKLMMLTFGAHPYDMFNEVQGNGDGYDVTMKDGYRVHVSRQELQQAAAASRFTGTDRDALSSAHFALAVFVKRKQLRSGNAGDLPGFESALTRSLQGETTFNMLKGMGLSGHLQYVPTATVVDTGATGVADSYDFGSSLIHAGQAHLFGRQGSPDRSYTYTLVKDGAPQPRILPAPVTPRIVPKVEPTTTQIRPEAAEILPGFTAPSRKFGETFDLSSHTAVIKMMMLRFGPSPSDMFERVEATEEGHSVTMKDGFEVTVSKQELQRTTDASRFTGSDTQMVQDANFMLAAFAKRKAAERNVRFDAALSSTLYGEPTYKALKGMGLVGFLRVAPPDKLGAPGSVGVTSTFNHSSALVVDGIKHGNGEQEPIVKDYGYQLAADAPAEPGARPAQFPAAPVGVKPADIWGGFYQGAERNCVTVSAIKVAMMKYGQNPLGIFKHVTDAADGYTLTMRDGCTVRLTHDELKAARTAANFHGADKGLIDDAVFLYAASAKRAQLENHEFRAGGGFDVALQTLNDGEVPGDALRRLGLYAFTRKSSVQELASGVPGTLANFEHSVAVVEGAYDDYGAKRGLNGSHWMHQRGRAIKLV